ncbi:heterokaryon incompatibility protein-domain-containing protein [Xylaria curta]|nr:heterokaryon incompatibility protein-domain-containing protein [Xylaria curta]
MAKVDLHSYTPIGPRDFRLVKFIQHEEQTITAVLNIFSVDEPVPAFYSLSYTWASEEADIGNGWEIQIDQRRLLVLDTLRPFVQAVVSKGMLGDEYLWWIDSICIDQANLEERAQQVLLMRNMYLKADQTIVWLGKESSDSNLAIDFIEMLDHTMQQGHTPEELRSKLQIDEHSHYWTALTNFFARRWWSRVWTIQEFVMPSTLTFWCGTREASRVAVSRSISAADLCTSVGIKATLAFRYGLNRKRVWNLYEESAKREALGGAPLGRPLLSLVAYFCCMDCTDDRDRLYGLRALASDGDFLDVNYSLGVQEIYLRFTQAFIKRHESLDIICFATVHSDASVDPAGQPFPSWVPHWHKKSAFLSLPVMVSQSSSGYIGNMRPSRFREYDPSVHFSASGNRAAVYEFENSTLLVQGTVIDEIDGLAASGNSEMIQSSSACNSTIQKQQSKFHPASSHDPSQIGIFESLCRSLVLDRLDRFLRYRMPADEFARDFLNLCALLLATADPQAQTVSEDFRQWYSRTRSLRIRGQSVESILRESLHLGTYYDPAGSAPRQDEDADKTFFGRWYDTVVRMSLRLAVSRQGRIGMAPEKALKGDLVCILYGCSVPVLLRRRAGDDGFSFVGECFLDRCMDGSILEQPDILEEQFMIR